MWTPQDGSQTYFYRCPIYEALYEGTRGGGKTDALIMDFAQHVGRGYGAYWRGIIFRHTYKQLEDIRAKTKRWFLQMEPRPRFNGSDQKWTWPDGEELLLRYMARPDDYWNYHGHEYPWIGWEELTNWHTGDCYESMFACSRSPKKGMPRKYRATCNPYGVGHNWVKARFIDHGPMGTIITDETGLQRVRITGSLNENKILLEADPHYIQKLEAITDEHKKKAWLKGSWDIVAGGYFDDVWRRAKHVIPYFRPPNTWKLFRSFDWGLAKPSSLGFWTCVTDNTPVKIGDRTRTFPRGTLIRLKEWYTVEKDHQGKSVPDKGLRLTNTELGAAIVLHSAGRKWAGCVADPSIWNETGSDKNKTTYSQLVAGAKKAGGTLKFSKASTSRKPGWQLVRAMLKESLKDNPEDPCLLFTDVCTEAIRTFPVLQKSKVDPDDIDTDQEDHAADEIRYACMTNPLKLRGPVKAVSF